jgi:hypothetical protein
MLPGFRFVFATVVLAVSVLVFGLGAAALLRASHDQFASLPSAQAPREPVRVRDQEARQTTLALLRVEMMSGQAETAKSADRSLDKALEPASGDTASAAPVPAQTAAVAMVASPAGAAGIDDGAPRAGSAASEVATIALPAPNDAAGNQGSVQVAPVLPSQTAAAGSAANAEARSIVPAEDKVVAPDPGAGAGCIPAAAATAPAAAQVALLVNPAPAQVESAQPDRPVAAMTTVAGAGKSAIHRARRARLRHHRPRRHHYVLRAQVRLPSSVVAQQQAQQANPFAGFPSAR